MKSPFIDTTLSKEYRPRLETIRDDILARKDPNFFWPTGTQVYVGRQGSGKTISAVHHVMKLKLRYPNAVVCSNLDLAELQARKFADKAELMAMSGNFDVKKDYIYFQDMETLALSLTNINNGRAGVIYLVDEIHTYFNALDSKNIPPYIFTEISQQRKQRKLIIGTSQLFLRMAKPFREQCDNLIVCRTLFGFVTVQKAFDGMTLSQEYDGSLTGEHKKTGWFFHTRARRNRFDTYQKVVSGSTQLEELTKPDKKPKMLKLKPR
jgi:zonular occludens toxin Zot